MKKKGHGVKLDARMKGDKILSSMVGSSYVEVARGAVNGTYSNDGNVMQREVLSGKAGVEVVHWDKESNYNSWLKFCAVGVLKSFSDVSHVIHGLMTGKYSLAIDHYGRITSQQLADELFMRIGWAIGDPLLIANKNIHRVSLYKGKVLILIPKSHRCPEVIKVVTGKKSFSVSVREDPVPVVEEWVSRRLWVGKYGFTASGDIGHREGFEKNEFPRQELMIVPDSKTNGEAAVNVGNTKEKVLVSKLNQKNQQGLVSLGPNGKPEANNGVSMKSQSKGKGIFLSKGNCNPLGPHSNFVFNKGVDIDGNRMGDWEDSRSNRSSSFENCGICLLDMGPKLVDEASKAREGQINGENFYIDLGLVQVKETLQLVIERPLDKSVMEVTLKKKGVPVRKNFNNSCAIKAMV
ncbi:hypothetical protein Q3G72_016922 [Acer saccharum]|nr:hypothetical protein Q3G72_016922 [Acer saccharum]